MNRYNSKDIEKILKSCLKYRYKLSKASLIAFLICGLFSYGATKVIETNGVGNGASIGPKGETIGEGSVILAEGTRSGVKGRKFVENGDFTKRIIQGTFGNTSEGFITIHGSNGAGEDYKYVKESVIIGNRATHINTSKAQVVKGIVAIGEKAAAYIEAVAVGRDSVASKEGSIALGSESYAGNKDNIALGRLAFTQNGDGIITIGAYSAALSKHSTSLGYGAIIEKSADGSLALGKEARVKTNIKNAIALGSYSTANIDVVEIKKDDGKDNENRTYISKEMEDKYKDKLLGAVSIGSNESSKEKYRQIVNLAPGTKEHDAVNLGQLREALKNASSSFIINTDNKGKTDEITKEFTIKGKTTNVGNNSNGNIITSVTNSNGSKNVVEIALNENLKEIETIGKDESLKISFEDKNSTKKIQITVDDKSLNVLKETNGIKISGVSEIENDRDNLIKFSKGAQGDISSVIKVGGVDLLLKKGNSSITISNVALGDITHDSTEAINGKQFYELSNNILGLKVEDNISKLNWTRDKKIKWNSNKEEKLENKNYKEVIEKLVDTINLGIKFKDGVDETEAFLLGSTISIQAGNFEVKDKILQTTTKFLSDNIRTKVSKDGLLIGIKENPSFKALTIRDNVTDLIQLGGSKDQGGTLIIKDGISDKASVEIKAKEKTIKLGEMQLNGKDKKIEGLDKIESSNKKNKIDLNKNGTEDIEITVQDKNITISKDNQNDGVQINGISQLGKNENNNISFNSKDISNSSLDIKIDGQNLTLTKDDENKIKISNVATPNDDYDAVNKKYVDDKIDDSNKKIDYLNQNIPVIYTDKDGNKLVKKDGKFYKTKDGKPTKETVDDKDVFVSIKDGEKLSSALGLNKDSKENDIKSAIDKLLDNITTNGNATDKFNLSNVATLRDLQALGKVGMDFEGDYGLNDENAKLIHNNLGQKLIIKGKIKKGGTAVDKDKLTDGNIGVIADKDAKTLSIGLSKDLINLESAEFTTDENRGGNTTQKVKTKINGSGTSIVELQEDGKTEKLNGKKAEYTLDGSKVNDGENKETVVNSEGTIVTDKNDKKQTKVNADGTTIKELDEKGQEKIDGKTAEYKLDGSKVTDGNDTLETTSKEISLKHKENGKDKEVISIKNNNGKGEINFASTGNDDKKVGSGKISGLADIQDGEKDGTLAANKNYVDSKVKSSNDKVDAINENIPVVYTDKDGNKVIRKADGKFYKSNDKTEEEIEAKDVYVSLKDKNNSSGLGLNNLEKLEYTKAQELIKTLNESEKDKPYLNNIATIRDLQALGLAGLNFTGNDKDNILHKNLGETLTIKGSGTLVDENNKFEGADGNINVKVNSDALEIELSKRLKDLETAVFEKEVLDKDGKMKKVTNTIDTNGSVINGVDGKSAKYTLEGSSIKDNDKEILTKADGITIKDKIDGKDVDVISIKNDSGKGKIEFSKDKDGKGTGTISGLADPTQDDHATNKHYVDSKIKELIDNSPIKYIDENGNRKEKGKHFIVGQDGKMYDPNLIKDKIYDKDKGGYVSKDDKEAGPIKAIENISAILDPKTKLGGLESTIENANEYINKENLDENEKKNAINSNDLHSVSKAIIEKGLSFGADKGKVTKKSLGETLNIKGGTNINTEVKDGNIIVNLNEEIKLTNTTLNKDGLNIKDDKGNLYINSNSIKGLADLNENSSGDLAANKNYVDSKAKEIKASSNGAIAGAIAMANLPQVSGNSIANVSAALGYQDKSVALALGVSGTNKKGNVVYKASGSINTQANVSLGAGLGYQFGVNRSKEIVDINSIKKVVNKHTVKIKQLEDKNKVLEKEVKINRENYNNLKENYNKINEKNNILEKELKEIKEILKKVVNK